MSSWGGLVAGALGGGAEAASGMAQGYIEDERTLDVAAQRSAMEEARQRRIFEFQEKLRREGRGADIQQDVSMAPMVATAAAATERTVGAARNETAVNLERDAGPVRATNAGLVTTAQGKAERGNLEAYGKSPGARAGARAKTADTESLSSRASAALTFKSIEEKDQYNKVLDDIDAVSADTTMAPAAKQQKLAQLETRRKNLVEKARGPGGRVTDPELDTVRITTEEENPETGAITKTERTEKRRPNKAASPAPGGKTATRAEVERYAAARGIPIDKAITGLQAQGYTIQ